MEDHEKHVRMVFQKLHIVGLYAKLEKCVFYHPQVEFLDYIISREGLSMDSKKIQTIMIWRSQFEMFNVSLVLQTSIDLFSKIIQK
jgi:hypothetical protein